MSDEAVYITAPATPRLLIIRTTIVQGGAEVIGGDIRNYQRDGGSRNAQLGVADDGVTVRNVDRPEGVHIYTRSRNIARSQGQ